MKRIFYLAVVALAAVANAQDRTISVTVANTPTITLKTVDVAAAREDHNGKACTQVGLPATCSQADLGPRGTIYTTNPAFLRAKVETFLAEAVVARAVDVTAARTAKKILAGGSEIASDATCAGAVGGDLGTGCTRLQVACRALTDGVSDTCK